MNRRLFITATGAAAAATSLPAQTATAPVISTLAHAPLPYESAALEPHIDVLTMNIHHGKHHATYVTKLQEAMKAAGIANDDALDLVKNIPMLPKEAQTAVRNNGGGHVNHSMFWKWMAPQGSSPPVPQGALGQAMQATFGGMDPFKKAFAEAATKRFGSGWAWLILRPDGKLKITSTANQDNPLMKGIVDEADLGSPLLGLDVWEHAYYLRYQNKRPDYITAWWNVVNWTEAGRLYDAAKA
jgi:Fe-Mn family superoxide dismutase